MSLAVTEAGSGAPVLLLHSSGLSATQWRRLSQGLATTHRVLAPDLPGYGRNPPLDAETLAIYGFTRDVDAVESLARDLGAPVHVIGHSYGGLLAFELARRGTVPIASLAAYEPVAFGVLTDPPDPEALAAMPPADAFFDRSAGLETFLARFVDWWNGPGAWAALPPAGKAPFLASGEKTFTEVRSLVESPTPAAAFRTITAPTLLLSGSRSPLSARRICARLAAALPHARHVELAGAGHMGPLTHGPEVNALLEQHVRAAS